MGSPLILTPGAGKVPKQTRGNDSHQEVGFAQDSQDLLSFVNHKGAIESFSIVDAGEMTKSF